MHTTPPVCMDAPATLGTTCSSPTGVDIADEIFPCEAGLYCAARRCTSIEKVGRGKPCASQYDCVEGLSCNRTATALGVCGARIKSGGHCDGLEGETECAAGLVCHHAAGAPGTCAPPARAGEACHSDDGCLKFPRLYCRQDGDAGPTVCRAP